MNERMLILLLVAFVAIINVAPENEAANKTNARASASRPLKLTPHSVSLANGKSYALNLPENFSLSVAAQNLKRVRFMARSPDGRIFVTDMYNRADNNRGAVYILDEFDSAHGRFGKVIPYLTNLRNPNSIAFYRDGANSNWFYLALTDRLLRYKYTAGENAPSAQPEVLATFPDYGLSYKYGGWHLTRTIAVGGDGKIYVSVGSSCNACEEKEAVRATIIEMDADGKNRKYYARGLRNAVGLRWVKGELWATNMGADHLGSNKPADTMYAVKDGANYGWPYCYTVGGKVYRDAKFAVGQGAGNCRATPAPYAAFAAHSSPLGFDYFGSEAGISELNDVFLVALHGSTKKSLEHGYRVALVARNGGATPARPDDFVTGFIRAGRVIGRPADVLAFGNKGFLLTDDYAGVIYYIAKK